jgi:hypothetical protein
VALMKCSELGMSGSPLEPVKSIATIRDTSQPPAMNYDRSGNSARGVSGKGWLETAQLQYTFVPHGSCVCAVALGHQAWPKK